MELEVERAGTRREERRRKINYEMRHFPHRLIFAVFVFHLQGYLLAHNQQQGVIISNHSLVIQGVSRTTAGNYSCVGFNAEGQGTSPPFQLNVLCKWPQLSVYMYLTYQPPSSPSRATCQTHSSPPCIPLIVSIAELSTD